MSILYYILGIVFFVVIIAICVVNISNYIEILNVADEQGTGDTNTGLSYSWVQTLIILNVIVGVISLVLFSYCISVLFIGEPINKNPIDLTDSELGPYVLEQFVAKKYFEETKKRNPNALRDAGKAATQELALMLYKENKTNSNLEAMKFMINFINSKKDINGKIKTEYSYVDSGINKVNSYDFNSIEIIQGVASSNIPWYKKFYSYLFEQSYDGVKIN
jgi:hypothetical protein